MKKVTRQMPVDNLGRVVIPIDIRRDLEIVEKDRLEVYSENGNVIFRKPVTTCSICNSSQNLKEHEGKMFCENCIRSIAQELGKGVITNHILQLDKLLDKKKKELDSAIEQGKSQKFIYKKSVEVDKIIAEYIKYQQIQESLK